MTDTEALSGWIGDGDNFNDNNADADAANAEEGKPKPEVGLKSLIKWDHLASLAGPSDANATLQSLEEN